MNATPQEVINAEFRRRIIELERIIHLQDRTITTLKWFLVCVGQIAEEARRDVGRDNNQQRGG